jgi:ketosteroid isomerase-like protein
MTYASLTRTPVITLVLLAVCTIRPANAGDSPKDDAAVSAIRRLVTTYAQSVDAADLQLAGTVWANTSDVSFIHPLGHEHGWEAVKTNLYTKLMGETFSERKLNVKDLVIHAYADAAWVEFYWDFVARFRGNGQPLSTHGRETQVYRKMDRCWRLVHVHYSGMPMTGERQGF